MDYKGFCELICADLDEIFPHKKYVLLANQQQSTTFECKANLANTSDVEFFKYAVEETDLKQPLKDVILKWRSMETEKIEMVLNDSEFSINGLMAQMDSK